MISDVAGDRLHCFQLSLTREVPVCALDILRQWHDQIRVAITPCANHPVQHKLKVLWTGSVADEEQTGVTAHWTKWLRLTYHLKWFLRSQCIAYNIWMISWLRGTLWQYIEIMNVNLKARNHGIPCVAFQQKKMKHSTGHNIICWHKNLKECSIGRLVSKSIGSNNFSWFWSINIYLIGFDTIHVHALLWRR